MPVLPEMVVVSCCVQSSFARLLKDSTTFRGLLLLFEMSELWLLKDLSSSFPKTLVLAVRCAPHPSPRFAPRPIVTHLIMELILTMYA